VFPQSSLVPRMAVLRAEEGLQIRCLVTPSILTSCAVSEQTTQVPHLQVFQALFRTRTGDPLLTMEVFGGTGGHGRALAITFFLQIEPSGCVLGVRACPRVPELMYPFRTPACCLFLKQATERARTDSRGGRVRWPAKLMRLTPLM
jgi:hypothetical protein